MGCAKGSERLRTTGELDAKNRGRLGEEDDPGGSHSCISLQLKIN